MTELPAPLVPANVDLRDFACLQIDIVRLFASDFHARSTDAEWRAGMTLWLKSFHQVPCASLPDDDIALARLAEFGRDQTSWLEVKVGALRNWIRCSDGRLYHRTVAIKALEAWIGKLSQRRSGAIGNAKRWKVEADLIEIDKAYASAIAALTALDPRSNALSRHRPITRPSQSEHHDNEVEPQPDELQTANPDRDPIPTPSQPDPDHGRGRIASEVKLREEIYISSLRSEINDHSIERPLRPAKRRKHPFPNDAFDRWYAGYPHKVGKDAAKRAFAKVVSKDMVAFDTLIDRLADYIRAKPIDRPWCNPATWLNEGRWADEPALPSSTAPPPRGDPGTTIDFGNGCSAPRETIRKIWGTGRWPPDWGAPPGQPGCRIPSETIAEIMGERAA
jgi:hypothetical protein